MRTTAQTPTSPVTVERTSDGAYVVHALTPNGVVSLGSHARVADAWQAIDALDSPVDALAQAA